MHLHARTGTSTGPTCSPSSVDDGNGGTDSASITITVDPVNDDPRGAVRLGDDDRGHLGRQCPLTATDVDGDALTFTYGPATNGIVSGGRARRRLHARTRTSTAPTAFGFTVDDGNGGTDSAIGRHRGDRRSTTPPVATGGTVTTPEDTAVVVPARAPPTSRTTR